MRLQFIRSARECLVVEQSALLQMLEDALHCLLRVKLRGATVTKAGAPDPVPLPEVRHGASRVNVTKAGDPLRTKVSRKLPPRPSSCSSTSRTHPVCS